jgi:hemerythrin-like domain-containing protein
VSFINLLRNENQLIQAGLTLLLSYCEELEEGALQPVADLRMTIYAFQVAYEASHLQKEETILLPALLRLPQVTEANKSFLESCRLQMIIGRDLILRLQLAIDIYEKNQSYPGLLTWRLNEFITHVRAYIILENTCLYPLSESLLRTECQAALLERAKAYETSDGRDLLGSPRRILNRLRQSHGGGKVSLI